MGNQRPQRAVAHYVPAYDSSQDTRHHSQIAQEVGHAGPSQCGPHKAKPVVHTYTVGHLSRVEKRQYGLVVGGRVGKHGQSSKYRQPYAQNAQQFLFSTSGCHGSGAISQRAMQGAIQEGNESGVR